MVGAHLSTEAAAATRTAIAAAIRSAMVQWGVGSGRGGSGDAGRAAGGKGRENVGGEGDGGVGEGIKLVKKNRGAAKQNGLERRFYGHSPNTPSPPPAGGACRGQGQACHPNRLKRPCAAAGSGGRRLRWATAARPGRRPSPPPCRPMPTELHLGVLASCSIPPGLALPQPPPTPLSGSVCSPSQPHDGRVAPTGPQCTPMHLKPAPGRASHCNAGAR